MATKRHTFVELNAQPTERVDDVFFGSRHESCRVGVLDSEHQIALMLAGKKIVEQCRPDTADMQRPRGTWRKTHPYFSFHELFFLNFCAKLLLFFEFCIFFSYFRILNNKEYGLF